MNPKKILVIRNDHIGDLILSSCVFRELRIAFPKERICVVASNSNNAIIEKNEQIDEIFIEAVACKKGDSADAVPDMVVAEKPEDITVQDVPHDEMLLRLSSSLFYKAKKYKDFINTKNKPYIIAVNKGALEHLDPQIPLVLKCLFGLGYEHFKKIAQSVDIPIILYNIASRTGVNIEPETIAQLARDCKNIIGVKEASGSLDQMSRIKQLCGVKFDLISGDDSLTLPILSIGGTGVISVVANIAPADVAEMVAAFEKGYFSKAQELHYKLLPLIKAVFLETNPIPIKTAMGLMRLCEPELRLPMCPMQPANLEKLKEALIKYGLLK